MKQAKIKRFNKLYQQQLRSLKLQGKAQKTIEAYSRAVRRVSKYFDCCPDKLKPEQLKVYFADLVESHSWSTVKIDRLGLQFFWKHVLKLDWQWVDIVKPPKVKTIPDILTPAEIEQLIGATRKLLYRVFLLTTYSMGLRLGETLSLQVGDIDARRKRVHIRRGKGHKDRLIPLPDLTLLELRELWSRHRHPELIFPNAIGSLKTIQQAKTHIDRGGTQKAMQVVIAKYGILKYLSRYLYRGVISEKNIISNKNGKVTFKYISSSTGDTQYRTLKGLSGLPVINQCHQLKTFSYVIPVKTGIQEPRTCQNYWIPTSAGMTAKNYA